MALKRIVWKTVGLLVAAVIIGLVAGAITFHTSLSSWQQSVVCNAGGRLTSGSELGTVGTQWNTNGSYRSRPSDQNQPTEICAYPDGSVTSETGTVLGLQMLMCAGLAFGGLVVIAPLSALRRALRPSRVPARPN
jgi:hypothetical protein